jgi:hypothetical protein
MENFSENKRKRGRPSKMFASRITVNQKANEYAKGLAQENCTDRTKVNLYYQTSAHAALWDGDYSYLFINDDSKCTSEIKKRTILQNLGRLEDDELIRKTARLICDNKLNTAEAVTYIRELKIGSKPAGSRFGLAKILAKNIDEYKLKHSGATDGMIRASLDILISVFPENISEIVKEYAEAV